MRALLSVYDKTGIAEFAAQLHELGVELVSSGGTAAAIARAGVPVTDVADLTGSPAILGHRVVTLHPKIHGGILADRDDPSHLADMEAHDIEPIDLVVANLYPFSDEPGIELIDIGGPTLVRAAAKNHAHVGIVVDPADYAVVLDEIRATGSLEQATRVRLARTAFAHTASYDASIVAWFDSPDGPGATTSDEPPLPPTIHLAIEREEILRYGENPHQVGARYRTVAGGVKDGWWDSAVVHGGKAMSYLNVYDTEAAWQLVWSLGDDPAAVVIKHANPCGVAVGDDLLQAYERAHACDSVSAFGGIVAVNRPLDLATAEALAPVFTEVVIAPSWEPAALETLQKKPNLRILEAHRPGTPGLQLRPIDGGYLVQTPDTVVVDRGSWEVVTTRQPTQAEWLDLELAWKVTARVSSNAIVLVKDRQAVGIGCGQQNRRDAGRIACEKAAGRAVGGAYASDAFFPFPDGLEGAIEAGATCVVQPGGSVRDDEVIAAANDVGLAMVLTGRRHFRH